jgi:hypothetical protein
LIVIDNIPQIIKGDLRVNFCCGKTRVPKQRLHGSNVAGLSKTVRRTLVAWLTTQGMITAPGVVEVRDGKSYTLPTPQASSLG